MMVKWLKRLRAERLAGLRGQANIYRLWGDWRPCHRCNTFWFCRERVHGCRQLTTELSGPRTEGMLPKEG